jgi:hypothetical protein
LWQGSGPAEARRGGRGRPWWRATAPGRQAGTRHWSSNYIRVECDEP